MTEQQRWRLWTRFVGASVIVGMAGVVLAVALRSRVLMVASLAVIPIVFLVMVTLAVRARSRPDLLVRARRAIAANRRDLL